MWTNDKLRLYLFLFLTFCVFSSKNILIYNEETLVALSFFCFIFFVFHYFGTSIKDSLNERSEIIQYELQNFLNLRSSCFEELLKQHQKVSGLVRALKTLEFFTNQELKRLNVHGEKALVNRFTQKIQQKLKTLVFSKGVYQQKLQYKISENILSNLLLAFQQVKREKGKSGNTVSIRNALNLLITQK